MTQHAGEGNVRPVIIGIAMRRWLAGSLIVVPQLIFACQVSWNVFVDDGGRSLRFLDFWVWRSVGMATALAGIVYFGLEAPKRRLGLCEKCAFAISLMFTACCSAQVIRHVYQIDRINKEEMARHAREHAAQS